MRRQFGTFMEKKMKEKVVSKSLKKALPLLKTMTRLSRESRKRILSELGKEPKLYKALNEIAHNTLQGIVELDSDQKRRIKPHINTLTQLCDAQNKTCAKKRKRLVIQSGGFLPILIPAITAVLSNLISNA